MDGVPEVETSSPLPEKTHPDAAVAPASPADHAGVEKRRGQEDGPWYKRQDLWAFVIGLVFIGALIGAMFGVGTWRAWWALSGAYHNMSLTSPARFLPEPDDTTKAGAWYYWKNKPKDTTRLTRLFVWACYATHQLAAWVLIYLAQLDKLTAQAAGPMYQTSMSKYGWLSLGVTVFFHVLHLLQTHITYDGLAKDVSITSSQCSVIMLLIVVLIMEYTERGYMLGWPSNKHRGKIAQKLRLNLRPVYMLRRYHGYAVSWAAIYTFWYHPMENTYGHALGFFYTFMFMLQGSMMYTKLHLNPWWRLLQEAWLVVHGGFVALQTGGPTKLWPMFTFGSLLMFALSWIFILPFWEKIPNWVRAFPPIIWLIIVIANYSWIPNDEGQVWVRIPEVLSIPAVFYLIFFLPWLVLYLIDLCRRKLQERQKVSEKDELNVTSQYPTMSKRILCWLGFLLVYIIMIGISVALEIADLNVQMFIGMIILLIVFDIITPISLVFIDMSLPKKSFVQKMDVVSHDNPAFNAEEK